MLKTKYVLLIAGLLSFQAQASTVSEMESHMKEGDPSSALTLYRANKKNPAVVAYFQKEAKNGQPLFALEYAHERNVEGKTDEAVVWFLRGHINLMKDVAICTNPEALKMGLQIEGNYMKMINSFSSRNEQINRILSMDPYFSTNDKPAYDASWVCRLSPAPANGALTVPEDQWKYKRGIMQMGIVMNMKMMLEMEKNPKMKEYLKNSQPQ